MIAYGCVVADERKYRRFLRPSIERLAGPRARHVELRDQRCVFRAYNRILDELAAESGLEGVVLVHEDVEIRDEAFERKLRAAFSDLETAVAGVLGGLGVNDIDWWVNDQTVGSATLLVLKPLETWGTTLVRPKGRLVGERSSGPADAVDGLLLALSPWAVRNLRFDEKLAPGFHGYDVDLCFQARERGKKVVVIDADVAHHRDTPLPASRDGWKQAHVAFRRKWEPRWPLKPPPWSPRRAGA